MKVLRWITKMFFRSIGVIIFTIVFVLFLNWAFQARAHHSAIPPAVGDLFREGQYVCTISVVAGPELGFSLELVAITAAHCVDSHVMRVDNQWIATKEYHAEFAGVLYDVVPILIGDQNRGYDVAVMAFESEVPDVVPFVLCEWETIHGQTPVVNYADPFGNGLIRFEGTVSLLRIRVAPSTPARALKMSVADVFIAPGSSGSLLLLEDERHYIGVVSQALQSSTFGGAFAAFVPIPTMLEMLSAASTREILVPYSGDNIKP